MKNRIQITLLTLAVILFASVAITGTSTAQIAVTPVASETLIPATPSDAVPASLPIGSPDELRAFAASEVTGGNMQIYGDSMMQDSTLMTYYDTPYDIEMSDQEALEALQDVEFRVRVTDRDIPLSVYGNLRNKQGFALFQGFTTATISPEGEIVTKGINLLNVDNLADWVPIYVGPNVQSADIKTENGWTSLNVWNGWLFFPKVYAGKKDGALILWVSDGEEYRQVGYSLSNGTQLMTYIASGLVSMKLRDHQSFKDEGMESNAILYVGLEGYVGDGHEAPVASIKITSTRTVMFACSILDTRVKGGVEIYPSSGCVFKKGSGSKTQIYLTPRQWSEGIELEPGQWYFYSKSGLYEMPLPPYCGGGKGG